MTVYPPAPSADWTWHAPELDTGRWWRATLHGLPLEVWEASPEVRVPHGVRWYVLLRGTFERPNCPRLEGCVLIGSPRAPAPVRLRDQCRTFSGCEENAAEAVRVAKATAEVVANAWATMRDGNALWALYAVVGVDLIGSFPERVTL